MKYLLLILCALCIVDGKKRILNGQMAREMEFPYQAYFRPADKDCPFCGAVIIGKRWLLTAAHCDITENNVVPAVVLIGTVDKYEGGVTYAVDKFIPHEDFGKYANDIALIRVKEEIKFNDHVQPIRLPRDNSNWFVNKWATIGGWGLVDEDRCSEHARPRRLQYIRVRITRKFLCKITYSHYCICCGICVSDVHICTSVKNGKSVDLGDSGGPVVVGDTLVGLVSFRVPGLPNVHTRVSIFLRWIKKQMKLYDDTN